ncbi:MAG: hypothetical protein PSV22_00200 [Pseudolabrys sp.]|nr:hypothetical protein [Pseudolabrys sp.]
MKGARQSTKIASKGQVVAVGGFTSASFEFARPGDSVSGTPAPVQCVVTLPITKTAGGAMNATAESIQLEVSPDDGTTWYQVYNAAGDPAPLNLLTSLSGVAQGTARKVAFIMAFLPGLYRAKIAGDGVDDTYTIDEDWLIVVA